MILTSALLEAYLPTALSTFLGTIRTQSSQNKVLLALGIFIGIYLLHTLLFVGALKIYNIFETKIFKTLIDDVFTHIQKLPEQFFTNNFSGSIISKIQRARQQIENFEDQFLIRIFSTLIILIGSIFFLALHFLGLALFIFAYLCIFTWVSCWMVLKISGPAQGHYADAQDQYSAHLSDSISNIATTKAYAKEVEERSRFSQVTDILRIKNLHAYSLGNLTRLTQGLFLAGMLTLLMSGGTWYYLHGLATVENMAYLAFAYTIMQSYIREVGDNLKIILTASYDLHAVIHLLQEKPEFAENSKLPDLSIQNGEIVFDKVGFSYPGKTMPIFKHLSVNIRAGERVALIGHSGGGKTSFIRLLQRLYTLQTGKIYIDGQDIASCSLHSLRQAIALVPQDPILFHRSLSENIAYAKPYATQKEIQAAAQQAHIHEFIQQLPQQYATLVGERGVKLSGGERQRIAIARAILADRPILILDEATSSLDSNSEQAIQQALHSLTNGRTSIMIAHRLSTILDADRILVFDKGQIIEAGSHMELIARPHGVYARLFHLQSGGFIPQ